MNIEEIAKLAGVSRSTISRVLNNRSDVSERTRQKVMRVIEENNYRPNPAARTLVTQHTRVIGILVPHSVVSFASPYLPTLLQGIGDTAHERDYATLPWWGQYGAEEERFTRRILHKNQLMEGLIVAFHSVDNVLISRMIETQIPFVMVERPTQFIDQISYVTIDNEAGAYAAVEHLISLGRCRIGHISGPMERVDGIDRLNGYRRALEKHHIPYNPDLVIEGQFDINGGYEGMREMLKRGVDAVFAGNDDTAAGALQAMREAGTRVPADVALVGFDDLEPALGFRTELTTIHQPVRQKGAAAASMLLDIIEGTVSIPQRVILPVHLIVRQTTKVAE